jgi:hypothetical protein
MALMLVGMLYNWSSRPEMWAWLATAEEAQADEAKPAAPVEKPKAEPAQQGDEAAKAKPAAPPETIVPGKNDLDAEEVADFKSKLPLVSDKTALRPREMPLYWKLMAWSRTEPFKKLEERADSKTSFSQIYEQPAKYRGKLLRLRMHVRRVLHYEAPENDIGVKNAYEIWGWTEDSKSFPYCVVVPELPPGLAVGPDVEGEVVFCGYFYKILRYEAFDIDRGAPLMVGRVRAASGSYITSPKKSSWSGVTITIYVLLVGTGVALLVQFLLSGKSKVQRPALPDELLDFNPGGLNPGGVNLNVTPTGESLPVVTSDSSSQ